MKNFRTSLRHSGVLFLLLLIAGFAAPLTAAELKPDSLEDRIARLEAARTTINTGDNAWMLTSTALVLMMTAPGLALFYGGLVRRKNVLATMMHSINQVKGVLFTIILAVVATFIILKVVDALVGLRPPEEEESQGLDLAQHGEKAYND